MRAVAIGCLFLIASQMNTLPSPPSQGGEEQNVKPNYPPTRTDNVVDVLHGVKIVDPYRWLEDGNSAPVKEWVLEQNKLTQSYLGKVSGRDAIRKRLGSLLETGS